MPMHPSGITTIVDDQLREAHERARHARLARESRTAATARPEPARRRVGLAVARLGLRIAGIYLEPRPS
jgi:hypothetical protein